MSKSLMQDFFLFFAFWKSLFHSIYIKSKLIVINLYTYGIIKLESLWSTIVLPSYEGYHVKAFYTPKLADL